MASSTPAGLAGRTAGAALLKLSFALAKGTSWCPMRLEPRFRFNERAIHKMKSYVPIAAALIAVKRSAAHPGDDCLRSQSPSCAALAIAVLALTFSSAAKFPPHRHRLRPSLRLRPERQAEAEVVAFIGLLQERAASSIS